MCDKGIELPLPEDINKWRKPFPNPVCLYTNDNEYWAPPVASQSRQYNGLIEPGIMYQANYNQLIAVQNHNNVCSHSLHQAMKNPEENMACLLDPQANCHGCDKLYFPPVKFHTIY
jgi:hypothetical protein